MEKQKTAKAVTILDAEALQLLGKRATREKRSVTSAAVVTIIEALSPKSHPSKHNFHDSIVEKGPKSQEIT